MLHLAIALFTLPDCLHFAVLCSVLIAGYMSYSPAGSNSLPARELYHERAGRARCRKNSTLVDIKI